MTFIKTYSNVFILCCGIKIYAFKYVLPTVLKHFNTDEGLNVIYKTNQRM